MEISRLLRTEGRFIEIKTFCSRLKMENFVSKESFGIVRGCNLEKREENIESNFVKCIRSHFHYQMILISFFRRKLSAFERRSILFASCFVSRKIT